MQTKHTPGPWKWDGNPCDYDPDQDAPWLVDSNDSYPPILGGTIKCQSEANARLIAAAPELLDALTKYVDAIASGGGGDKDLFMQAIRQADDKARAAIAKATGGGV